MASPFYSELEPLTDADEQALQQPDQAQDPPLQAQNALSLAWPRPEGAAKPEAPPTQVTPFSLLAAPSAAAGAFLGSVLDKPRDPLGALKAAGSALFKAPFQDPADQPSPSKVFRERGGELPWLGQMFVDAGLDPTNAVGGEPITGAAHGALALAAATPGMIKGLRGLTSRILTEVLPLIGKKGVTGERLLSLLRKGTVAADELTPALTEWIRAQRNEPITREALGQAVADKGLRLSETRLGPNWPGVDQLPYGGATKWDEYALSGAEKYRESLIHTTPETATAFDPANVQWRELDEDEKLGYVRPAAREGEDRRVWRADDPEGTLIIYDPARARQGYSKLYTLQGTYRNDMLPPTYSSFAAAKALYPEMIEQKGGYSLSAPPQRLEKTGTGYRWVAEGVPDATITLERQAIDEYTPATYRVHLGERDSAPKTLADALYSARQYQANEIRKTPLAYRSSHWEAPNVLAHTRVADHELAGGGRALNIEEIQSDWHTHESNGGRYFGYLKPDGQWIPPEYTVEKDVNGVTVSPKAYNKHRRKEPIHGAGATEAGALADLRAKFAPHIPPDAPFKGHKVDELAFKRMLAHAAEHGYDALTWTTADQQAERYNRLLRDVTAIRLEPDGVLSAQTANRGWQRVEGTYLRPEDTAAVIGPEAAERLAASAQKPGWSFDITDPDGGVKTMSFTDVQEARAAQREAEAAHKPKVRDWDDLTSGQQDEVRSAWEDDQRDADAFGDASAAAADSWLQGELDERVSDDDVFEAAKAQVLERAKAEGHELDPDSFDYKVYGHDYGTSRRSMDLHLGALRLKDGARPAPHVQHDIGRWFEESSGALRDEMRNAAEEELSASDAYFDAMHEGFDQAAAEAWHRMRDRDRMMLAERHLDSDVFSGDGHEVGPVIKTDPSWFIDLADHPITIGSKGMEEEYDKVLPKLAQQLSSRYGDGAKVQKMRINADAASGGVAQIQGDLYPTANRLGARVRVHTPLESSTFMMDLPRGWTAEHAAPGQWIARDGYGTAIGDHAFATREEAEAAAAAGRKTHEVWGLPIGDKLRAFIKEKGLPLASVLLPTAGMVVTLKDGTRVRVRRVNDDGSFDGTPITKGRSR